MKAKHQFTKAQEVYMHNNYLLKSSNDLGKYCKCTGQVIRRWLKENSLIVPIEVTQKFRSAKMVGKTSLSKKEDKFIKANYLTMPVKRIATKLNRSGTAVDIALKRLGLVIPKEIIEQRKRDSRIKAGNISFNKGKKQSEYMSSEAIEKTAKTRFNKGNRPHNTKEADGAISIRAKKGDPPYKYIRISLGKWVLLQRHKWEKVNGKIPDGYCLWCLGDTMNCEPDNWELITRKENRIRNSGTRDLSDKRVANYLSTTSRRYDPDLRETVLQQPELITAKRTQLLITRKIKEHGTKQNSRP